MSLVESVQTGADDVKLGASVKETDSSRSQYVHRHERLALSGDGLGRKVCRLSTRSAGNSVLAITSTNAMVIE